MTGAPGHIPDVSDGEGPMLAAGKMVGRYRLLSLVASGGMAQIWAAKPESGGFSRTVALKVVRPEYASDEEYRRMLIDEAAAASAVHHPTSARSSSSASTSTSCSSRWNGSRATASPA